MSELWRFDSEGKFIMDDVRALPQPVVHMLANCPQYFSICDNYLRGYSGFDYTRMFGEFDGPNFPKHNARFHWIRMEDGTAWLANDPFGQNPDENPACEMGLGYVTFTNGSKKRQLTVKSTVFVPLDEMIEVWLVEITNNSGSQKTIDFIPAVPIFGGNRAYTEYHRDVVRLYNKSRINDFIAILPGLEWVEGLTNSSDICYFMAAETDSGKKGDRMYSDRETFLGPMYSWMHPEAVLKNLPPKVQCLGKEAVGAIEFQKVPVAPGQSARFVVLNGISKDLGKAEELFKHYNHAYCVSALEKVKEFWKERTSRVTVKTSNELLDISWNNWWCYQLSMRYWFGNTGHPQFDYGSDFAGWRDFWQDMMAATVIDPGGLEKRTLHTLEGIRLDGTNATRFFARTKEFGSDEINGLWCDHPYWTAQTVMLLINFLGDVHFLLKGGIAYFKDCYRNRGETKDLGWKAGLIERQKTKSGEVYKGTVAEHLLTQLLTMFYDVGRNNLLRQKRADWNDAVDQVKGENVTFSLGLAHDCNELADFLDELHRRTGTGSIEVYEELSDLIEDWSEEANLDLSGEARHRKLLNFLENVNEEISGSRVRIEISKIATDLRNKAKTIIKHVNKIAWNSEYYTGYFHADGRAVDTIFEPHATTKENPTTDDFVMMLMPQTWAILSGAADELGVTEDVIKSVFRILADPKVGGLKLNYPAYWEFDKNVGRITGFAAGTKENNAIFCHANLFMVWALLRKKRPEDAWKIFSGINPLNHPKEVLRTGPWLPEYYVSGDNPNLAGRGEYPMLTASGGWTRYVFQNFFFGVRGELDGLRIDPCLPAAEEFRESSLTIHFRGAEYQVNFRNPELASGAAAVSISVDGKKIDGNLVKSFHDGKHVIEVILGKAQ
ncbi:MAG: hypothetical protein JW803_07480 [Endomicrobiales bacterium]|nr:hypothetical protein [Endomicrobiales bacterium]